jgi:two-component system, LuxR family, sensor kinase FixL
MSRWAKFVAKRGHARLRGGGVAAVAALAVVDWAVKGNVGLGFLYLIPIAACAFAMSRIEIAALSAVCALLRESFSPFAWQPGWPIRLEAVGGAFAVVGLLVYEIEAGWRAAEGFAKRLARESDLRREAEEQMRMVLQTSPLAILAVAESHLILMANESARLLFDSAEPLGGKDLRDYLPHVQGLFDPTAWDGSRTMMETGGLRGGGLPFVAQVWCAAVKQGQNRQFTLAVWDATDSLRDREEAGLENFLATSRIVVGAVSHEIRNMAVTASVALSNLGKDSGVAAKQDYLALVSLMGALEEMARLGLRTPDRKVASACDLTALLHELRIIIEPVASEAEVAMKWEIGAKLPLVRGNHTGLLQVFLNLAKNSIGAMAEQSGTRELRIDASREGGTVTVDIRDTGPGIRNPEALFRPFQDGATNTGLGLYVSRATVRACAGELYCKASEGGAWFQVKLAVDVRAAHA